MQALNSNANYDAAMRVRTSVEKMAGRLLALDNKEGFDTNPTDQVVDSSRWHGASFDGGPNAEFGIRGTASKADGDASSASVQVLMAMDTATYSHAPKQVKDGAGNVVANLHEYKIDSPSGTQTAIFNSTNGTVAFIDKPVESCLW